MSQKKKEWIRTYKIGIVPEKSGKSTLFQVTSVLFPVGFPEAASRLVVKKRYQDFQALQKSLSEIHKSLYLDGKFPELPKVSKGYFRKSQPSPNVEESLKQCQKLLEFCSKFPALCNSKIFTAFFADLESPKTDLESPDADGLVRGDVPDCDILGRNGEVAAFGAIRDLARKGNIFEAAAVSTSLAPDPTPSLIPDRIHSASPEAIYESETGPTTLPEYLNDAASLISMAIQYESEENYGESVACYRNAIGTLLQSVPKDSCLKRQASVKRRISQYISKAEKLIELDNKLHPKSDNERSNPPGLFNASSRIPHLDLFGNIRDLRKYKIRGVLANKVIVVSEPQTLHDQVVIKALQKSSLVFKTRKTSMLPINVPFMVKLLRYFETEEIVYLVLEYVPYGPILPIVKPFLRRQSEKKKDTLKLPEEVDHRPDSSFSNQSIVRTSPSFIQLRRSSVQADPMRVQKTFANEKRRSASSEDLPNGTSIAVDYQRTFSLETGETSSVEDFNFVYVQNKDDLTQDLFCVDKDGIEKFNSTTDEGFDEAQLSSSEETNPEVHFDLRSGVVSIKISDENNEESQSSTDIIKIVKTTEDLLSSVSSHLQNPEVRSAENALSEVEEIVKNVHLHIDGRSLTPSPVRSFRAASGSPVSPPSTSSVASSPPPLYAEDQAPPNELILSDLVPSIDGIDLLAPNAILPVELLRRWTTQLCHVLINLHSKGIIIKDLNPANILLGRDLQIRLTYQCEWVSVDKPVNWNAIEELYSAPEVADIGPHTPSCDWWSVGAILYELLTGHRLVDIHPAGVRLHIPLQFPESQRTGREVQLESEMRDLIAAFLTTDPAQRLGAGSSGPSDIKSHPFFKTVNWSLFR